MAIFVEGDKARWNGSGEVRRDVLAVSAGRRGRGRECLGIRNCVVRNVDEGAFVTPTAVALVVSFSFAFAEVRITYLLEIFARLGLLAPGL